MSTKIKIPKNRLYAPINFDEIIGGGSVRGVELTYTEYGFVQFESGMIVLFDAYFSAHKYIPFDVECGIVAFPFYCGCMTDKGERVAYAGLRFCDDKAVEWRALLHESDMLGLVTDPQSGAVPVMSGVCCLSDAAAYAEYAAHIKDEIHPLAGEIVLDGQIHTVVELYGSKYAVFSSGWGDGRYKCYAGFAADGRVTAIVVDFGMIDYPPAPEQTEYAEIEIESGMFVPDPGKSKSENNVARWSAVLETATDRVERLRAYSRRGYAYHSANDLDRALSDYMSAIELARSVTDREELLRAWSVYDNAAEILCSRNEYEKAIALMRDALEVSGTFNKGAYLRLIDVFLTLKHNDKALEVAKRMCERRPDDPVAHMKYAECCVAVMDYESAAAAYERLSVEFKLYENLFDEASCFIELGDYSAATAALERHPAKEAYEQYWYYTAYIEYKKHRLRPALGYAERAHEIDREYMPALYLLIDIESVLNEYYAVARYAEEYKRLRPDNEFGYSVCAEAHMLLGNFTECQRNYSHLYDRIKPDDKYAALAAIVCNKTGDNKCKSKMMKALKRKKSGYYYSALYSEYILKYRKRDVSLERVMYKIKSDDEFLLMLSVFLLRCNSVVQATRILEECSKSDNPPYDLVAQQIRLAERIGDKKLFLSFLKYYVKSFIDPDAGAEERKSVANSFIINNNYRARLKEV